MEKLYSLISVCKPAMVALIIFAPMFLLFTNMSLVSIAIIQDAWLAVLIIVKLFF